jgi:hypothetical protein
MRLPDKMSELLQIALNDLNTIKSDDTYVVDFKSYHTPDDRKCRVCLAGCVIAITLNMDKSRDAHPSGYDRDTAHKLEFISAVALQNLGFAAKWYFKTGLSHEEIDYKNRVLTVSGVEFYVKQAIKQLVKQGL